MPTRIGVLDRVIEGVGVPIIALRIFWLRDDGIRLDEPPQPRLIIPRIVIVQSGIAIIDLSGVLAARGIGGAGIVMGTAPGVVAHLGGLRAAIVQRVARTAQMVYQNVTRRTAPYPLRDALSSSVVIFGERAATILD